MIKGTITKGLAFNEYLKIEAEHSSGLKRALISGLMYKSPPPEDSDTLRIGRAVHMAITDFKQFSTDFVVWRGGRRYGKEWDKFCAENSDKTTLTAAQYLVAMDMRQAVNGHRIAARYLNDGAAEVTLLWQSEQVHCKARIDWLHDDAIVDIKTTKNPAPAAFASDAARYHYHMQLAWYQAGIEAVTGKRLPCKVIAVQNVAPYDVVVFDVGNEALAIGRAEYNRALDLVIKCRESGKWPGMAPTEEVPLILPQWSLPAIDDGEPLTFGGVNMFAAEGEAANG